MWRAFKRRQSSKVHYSLFLRLTNEILWRSLLYVKTKYWLQVHLHKVLKKLLRDSNLLKKRPWTSIVPLRLLDIIIAAITRINYWKKKSKRKKKKRKRICGLIVCKNILVAPWQSVCVCVCVCVSVCVCVCVCVGENSTYMLTKVLKAVQITETVLYSENWENKRVTGERSLLFE